MRNHETEPGLLPIFRFYLIAQLVIVLVNLHVHSSHGLLPGRPWLAAATMLSGTAILLAYLSWRGLRAWLGRPNMPIAIVLAVIFSVTTHYLFLGLPMSGHPGSSEESAWMTFLFLFVPLVLVDWQYGFRWVVAYCLFTTFLDYALVRWVGTDFAAVQETYSRLLFIRFFSFMFVGYVVSKIMTQLRRERQALQEANSKLERFVATLEELTVSRERNRVARELHDTLAHTLSGLAVQLEAVDVLWNGDRDEARRMLQKSLGVTRDGLTETRRAIQALRASPLEDLGLARALRRFAAESAERVGLTLDLDLSEDLEGLPAEVEHCFYRIGQEAIENVAKHAQARYLKVRVAGSDSEALMEIIDDGIGFDPATVRAGRHFGLQGMRERAGLIGATIDLASEPGKGTRVGLEWRRVDGR